MLQKAMQIPCSSMEFHRICEITYIFERFATRKCLKMSVFKRFVKEKLPFSTIQRVSLDNLPEADPRLWRGLNNLLNSR